MNIIRVSDEELRLLRSAMQMYLRSFGHNEADTVERVKSALRKLAEATREDEPADLTGGPPPVGGRSGWASRLVR